MIFNTKILLRRHWRIGFFRGWFILDISGFQHSKPDSAASLKSRRNYEVFFLYPILQRLHATLYYICGFLKSSQLVANVRLVYCMNAARFLNVASQARGDITHFSDFFDLGFCLNSDYSISAARARCTNNFSWRFTLLLVLFHAFVQ